MQKWDRVRRSLYPPSRYFSFCGTAIARTCIPFGAVITLDFDFLMVFGFKYEPAQTASLEALQRLYVGSASGVTLSDLAARCVTRPIVLEQLSAEAAAKGWNVERQAYWTALKGRASRVGG